METSPLGPPLGAPLAGVRVLDLSQVIAGPLCGRVLADLGADVIKIEAPHGDRTREVLPLVNGQSQYYTHMNAGKRGVGVDLRTDAGAALVARLAEHADVFVENFRPGVLARLGLGPDDLLARNPRLVYCSITGWGQDGPWAQRQAYAPLIHAEAGRIELAARLRDEPPRQEIHNHGDINAAMCATSAVLAALFQAERTGRGQHLDVSLAEALVYTDEWSSTDVHGYGRERFFDIWTHPVFTLADGADVAMVGNPVRLWDQWLAALGEEPRPCPDDRGDALEVLRALAARVPDFPTLEAKLEAYPMLVAEVRSVAALAATPWAETRGVFRELEPGTRVVAAPFRSREADVGVRGPAPRAGEHTRSVLGDVLGLDDAELDTLFAEGAIY
jgi:CoA:oxalate CoA-transferase